MGIKYADFRHSIGDNFTDFGRNIMIIERKYVDKTAKRREKAYIRHEKVYKYKCLKCGNEDWLTEDLISGKQHIGCNACCSPPHKLVVGVNDITTTAPWMIKYFQGGSEEAKKYFKFCKTTIDMVCPDCGRIHKSTPHKVYNAHNLTCPCQDGWSYPNKFMYALLEQLGVNFQPEKIFKWSDGRVYDDYIEYKDLKIITEQHGAQHYKKPLHKNGKTVKEEQKNDFLKYQHAIKNGISNYIVIDSNTSSLEHMKQSILDSGLLYLLDKNNDDVNWIKCHDFATSNLSKLVCLYKDSHQDKTLHEIADIFKISYKTILHYVKTGSTLGWCTYEKFEDMIEKRKTGNVLVNTRPIHCLTNNRYYRSSKVFVEKYLTETGTKLCDRNIRSVCNGKRNHVNNMKFEYITQEEFNKIKSDTPNIVYGNYFKIK